MCENNIKKICAKEICESLGFEVVGPDTSLILEWNADNRVIEKGNGFIAIKGAKVDGHDFIADAIASGASVIVAEKNKREYVAELASKNSNVTFILVNESIHDFACIAKAYLEIIKPIVVAITGSVGKTTTKELCLTVAGCKYRTYGTKVNRNTLLGTSLTIMSMPNDTEVLVLEFGTNHFGEIQELADYFPPDIAIITEIADAHLEAFKSRDGVLKEKTCILSHKEKLKTIIYNKDNEHLRFYFDNNSYSCPIYAVGKNGNCKINEKISLTVSPQKTSCNCEIEGQNVVLESSLFGVQHIKNMAFALCLGHFFKIDLQSVKEALASMAVLEGRGRIYPLKNHCYLIDEAYNSNPTSCEMAIKNMLYGAIGENTRFKTCAVLGGMRELGEKADSSHQYIIDKLTDIDYIYLLGEEWKNCNLCNLRYVEFCDSLDTLKQAVCNLVKKLENTIVLVKGSNSYGLCNVVNDIMG
ncbi:MAG: UDP-N-acetylmuramoyl-tripeptide--D-alanyl-D-alanine ligase [Synergistaceae bacterium]|nr:UDP-N-acetylmuramoyl-tripeptide--D-alanyl-D-alanine ligase [Synergistaceae bacterium]